MPNRLCAALGAATLLAACGGGKTNTTGPSNPPAATITITSGGVNPRSVTIPRGGQVQFVNSDSIAHNMTSNPHPEHTDCPEINAVGFLSANQRRQTGNLNTPRTCGFHDHDLPNNIGLQGSIVIQ